MRYSVITPVWNREDCVLRCLESVTTQLTPDYEVEHIVVDDGSTDSTLAILSGYASEHPHVTVITFPSNRGTNAARNAAIAAASGDWIIPLDSDDWFRPAGLLSIHRLLAAHPGFGIYMLAYVEMRDIYDRAGLHDGDIITFEDKLAGRCNADFNHVIRREIMQHWPFDEHLRIYEHIFYLRFYREAGRMYFSSTAALQLERDRSDSVSREMLRFSRPRIQRAFDAAALQIRWFADDYHRLGLDAQLEDHYRLLFDNALLLGDYTAAREALPHCGTGGGRRMALARLFFCLRMATLYRWLIYAFLHIKYNILGSRLTQK